MLLERILKEELLVMKLNRKILVEHKKLVSERQDWYSLVAEEYMKLEQGEDFDSSVIEEGVWSKIKYYMAKLPNIEKGGKIFGRTKRTKEAAEKLEAAIANATKKTFGDFRKKIEKDYPEFPNMESKEEFMNALLDIGAIYDSLDAVVGKGIDAVSANAVVDALREYVTYLLDYELSDTYKHFNEGQELEEAVGRVTSTAAPERRTPRRTGTAGGGGAPEDPDAPKGKFTKRGAQGDAVDSATLAGLASNKLPAILALSGAAGVLAGMLAKSGWALDALKQLRGIKNIQQVGKGIEKIRTVLSPQPNEGFTQMFGRIANADPSTFGPNTDPQALFSAMKQMGIDPQNPKQLFELGVDPQAYSQAIQSGAKTIGEMFPASNRELWLDKGAEAVAEVTKEITKKLGSGAAGGAATVAAGQLAAASTLASTLGIGLVAAGAAVKLIRIKGQKSSRAQLLQDLSKELQPFDVPDNQQAIDPQVDVTPGPDDDKDDLELPEPENDQQGGDEQGGGDEQEGAGEETNEDPIPLFDYAKTDHLAARMVQSLKSQGIQMTPELRGVIKNIMKDISNQLKANDLTVKESIIQERPDINTHREAWKLLKSMNFSYKSFKNIIKTLERIKVVPVKGSKEAKDQAAVEAINKLMKHFKVSGPEEGKKFRSQLGKVMGQQGGGGLEALASKLEMTKTGAGGYVTGSKGKVDIGRAIGGKIKNYLSAKRFNDLSKEKKQKIIKTLIFMSKKFIKKELAKRNIEDIKVNETLNRWQKIAGINKKVL